MEMDLTSDLSQYPLQSDEAFLSLLLDSSPTDQLEISSPLQEEPEELLATASPYDTPSPQENTSLAAEFDSLLNEISHYGGDATDFNSFAQNIMTFPEFGEDSVPSSPQEDSSSNSGEEKSNPKKRKRIRKRVKKEEGPVVPTAVSLPREKLLVFTSKQMQEYESELRRTRELTPEEEKDIKRQKRLIKNRESALASRTRKKAHIDELQTQITEIKQQKDELAATASSLASENYQLKQQVAHYQNLLKKTSMLSELWDKMMNSKSKQKYDATNVSGFKTATACLFVVLFTFGFLFDPLRGPLIGNQLEKQPLSHTIFMEDTESSLSSADLSHSSLPPDVSSFSRARKLLSFDDEEQENVPIYVAKSNSSQPIPEKPANEKLPTIVTTEEILAKTAEAFDELKTSPLVGTEYEPETKPHNSSYFLCTIPKHVSLDESTPAQINDTHLVTFLVPTQNISEMASQANQLIENFASP